jgi:hyperosmotically inducible periplasmic protein
MNKYTGALTCAALLAATMFSSGCSEQPEPLAPTSAPTGSAANVSDMDVTEHVMTALRQSEVLKGVDINVVTLKGDVRLIGVLDNQAQVDEAVKIARASDGTHAIHDELTIKK